MAGAGSAVIHPYVLSSSFSASMRALVIMPRSPAMTIRDSPNLPRTTLTISVNAAGSPVLPGSTRTATGRPSGSVSSPYSICSLPFLPSREYPRPASGQCVPSSQELDRSNSAILDGFASGARCRRASLASMASCRAASQSIAAYTSSTGTWATPRSAPSVVSSHHASVDSFEPGATTREMIRASARSRCGQAGPSSAGSPSLAAMACTAATWPCGSDRVIVTVSACRAGTRAVPLSAASIESTACSGRPDRFARVSWRTLLPSR